MAHPARVLILEDQMIVAFALQAMLSDHGIETVGPFADAPSALKALPDTAIDLAILDINLGGEDTSEPVADALMQMGIPFVFLTGYGSGAPVADRFSHINRFLKPVRLPEILSFVDQTMASARSA